MQLRAACLPTVHSLIWWLQLPALVLLSYLLGLVLLFSIKDLKQAFNCSSDQRSSWVKPFALFISWLRLPAFSHADTSHERLASAKTSILGQQSHIKHGNPASYNYKLGFLNKKCIFWFLFPKRKEPLWLHRPMWTIQDRSNIPKSSTKSYQIFFFIIGWHSQSRDKNVNIWGASQYLANNIVPLSIKLDNIYIKPLPQCLAHISLQHMFLFFLLLPHSIYKAVWFWLRYWSLKGLCCLFCSTIYNYKTPSRDIMINKTDVITPSP